MNKRGLREIENENLFASNDSNRQFGERGSKGWYGNTFNNAFFELERFLSLFPFCAQLLDLDSSSKLVGSETEFFVRRPKTTNQGRATQFVFQTVRHFVSIDTPFEPIEEGAQFLASVQESRNPREKTAPSFRRFILNRISHFTS